ncbi:MAG: hypothetical protein J2P46_21660 [Zavarzinella sp.]|nr:hypothetical protein [Zavarzinella sp.]
MGPGGFGSAVVEACDAEGIELSAELGLDVEGLCRTARRAFASGREGDLSAVG